jgi:hypothetical protein
VDNVINMYFGFDVNVFGERWSRGSRFRGLWGFESYIYVYRATTTRAINFVWAWPLRLIDRGYYYLELSWCFAGEILQKNL